MYARRLITSYIATLLLAGCSKTDGPTVPLSAAGFDDAVPDCLALTALQSRGHRIAADRECPTKKSMDDRMKSKGCLVRQELDRCLVTKEAQLNGFDSDQLTEERAEARRQ